MKVESSGGPRTSQSDKFPSALTILRALSEALPDQEVHERNLPSLNSISSYLLPEAASGGETSSTLGTLHVRRKLSFSSTLTTAKPHPYRVAYDELSRVEAR
jgi:hypothetical protein